MMSSQHLRGLQFLLMGLSLLFPAVPGEVVFDYDATQEGKVGTIEVVETHVENGHMSPSFIPSADGSLKAIRDLSQGYSPRHAAVFDLVPSGAVAPSVEKRQTCASGYGYCPNLGGCCPSSNRCCGYGYCLPPGSTCCPTGPCADGMDCCGAQNCMPPGSQCCADGSHCPRGNTCVIFAGASRPRCCTDLSCTAYVGEDGRTTSATTRTTTSTMTTTSWRYYYWTVTWYYYSYYWTYSIRIEASVVTSTRVTTSTSFSVSTTDASAASSYFSSISSSFTPPTPAAATTLASLTGSTSYVGSPTPVPAPTSSAGTSSSSSSSASATRPAAGTTIGTGGGGSGSGAARPGLGNPDGIVTAFIAGGLIVGLFAVLL